MSKPVKFISQNSRLFFFSWLLLILITSSIPQLPIPRINTSGGSSIRLDYYIHVFEFFILSIFFMLWMINLKFKRLFDFWILVILTGIASSFLIELYQKFIPGRTFNIVDCYYNISGFLIGIGLLIIINHKKHVTDNSNIEK